MILELLVYRKPMESSFNMGSTLFDQSIEGEINKIEDLISLFRKSMEKISDNLHDEVREAILNLDNTPANFYNALFTLNKYGIYFNVLKMEDRTVVENLLDGQDRVYLLSANAFTEQTQIPIMYNARSYVFNDGDSTIESLINLVQKYTAPELQEASGLKLLLDSMKAQKELDKSLPFINMNIFSVMEKLGYSYLIVKDLS